MGAGLAQMLPVDLFINRHGRAACRILGIHYRQAKRGAQLNGEILDWGKGWKQIETANHTDKIEYEDMRLFWKSPEASAPDNQNKEMIRLGSSRLGQVGPTPLHIPRATCADGLRQGAAAPLPAL